MCLWTEQVCRQLSQLGTCAYGLSNCAVNLATLEHCAYGLSKCAVSLATLEHVLMD